MLCDSGYTGKPFEQGVQDIVGEHVTVQIAKRSELHTFKVMPKRWIVERSFAWLDKNRRLASAFLPYGESLRTTKFSIVSHESL